MKLTADDERLIEAARYGWQKASWPLPAVETGVIERFGSPQPAKTYNFDQILDELGPEHRAKVEKRFKELLADYNAQEPVSSPQPAKPARTCSDERPCIPCYSDMGECIGPHKANPAGAVPLPAGYPWIRSSEVLAYGNACAAAAPHALRAKLRSCEQALAAAEAREAAAGGVPAITESRVELAREAYYNAASVEDGCYTAPDAMRAALAAGGVPEAWRKFVEECSRTAGGEVCGNQLSKRAKVLLDAIPQQPTAEPAADGLSLKSRPDFISGYDAGVADEKLTQACNPAVEATGTVYGYRRHARTVEIMLDFGVPRWMIYDKTRVTISPTGGKSDA